MHQQLQEASGNSCLCVFQVMFSLSALWLPRYYSQNLAFSKDPWTCYFLCLNPRLLTGQMRLKEQCLGRKASMQGRNVDCDYSSAQRSTDTTNSCLKSP